VHHFPNSSLFDVAIAKHAIIPFKHKRAARILLINAQMCKRTGLGLGNRLPAHQQLSELFKCSSHKSFGHHIRWLVLSADADKLQDTVMHSLPEKMCLCRATSGTRRQTLGGGKLVGSSVVFKDSGAHADTKNVCQVQGSNSVLQQSSKTQQLSDSKTNGCTLRLNA
jgi:hypothetical protein